MAYNPFEEIATRLSALEQSNQQLVDLLTTLTQPQVNQQVYKSRREVAEQCRISLPTLSKLTKEGRIRGYRFGKRVLYKPHEVDQALSSIKMYRRSES